MKMVTVKTTIKNRLMLLLPVGGVVLYILYFFLRNFGSLDPEDIAQFVRIMQYIGVVLFAILPFALTITITKIVLKFQTNQSTVDHTTYVNTATMTEFMMAEDPSTRILADHQRRDALSRSMVHPDNILDGVAVEPYFPVFKAPNDDLPEYDPEGPNPFKKPSEAEQ